MAELHLLYLVKHFLSFFLIISLTQHSTTGDEIGCLRAVKDSISDDPNGYLTTWDLTNTAQGSICKFNGIECWNPNENRVLNIRLSNMGLVGHFPSGLQLCESLTGLDLSSNNFTGSIPENINDMHNQLTGNIPSELARLTRLTTFNVASNQLTGPIPAFKHHFSPDSYMNNSALCGPLLNECRTSSKKRTPGAGVIVAAALGAVTGFSIGVVLNYMVVDSADRVTPWFNYYIKLRKFTLYLFSCCARDHNVL